MSLGAKIVVTAMRGIKKTGLIIDVMKALPARRVMAGGIILTKSISRFARNTVDLPETVPSHFQDSLADSFGDD